MSCWSRSTDSSAHELLSRAEPDAGKSDHRVARKQLTVMRLLLLSILLLATLGACVARPARASEPCALPSADESWSVAVPEDVGLDAELLCALSTELSDSETNVHSFLVARRGKLVAELYRSAP